jgi:hypothetical protein
MLSSRLVPARQTVTPSLCTPAIAIARRYSRAGPARVRPTVAGAIPALSKEQAGRAPGTRGAVMHMHIRCQLPWHQACPARTCTCTKGPMRSAMCMHQGPYVHAPRTVCACTKGPTRSASAGQMRALGEVRCMQIGGPDALGQRSLTTRHDKLSRLPLVSALCTRR